MTAREAKEILLLYRPGTRDAEDPEVAGALELARQSPELAGWLEEHCRFQATMRSKLREVPVSNELRSRLLASRKVVPLEPWWSAWRLPLAIAAVFVILLGALALSWPSANPNRFANFRDRMVSSALREYRMDLVTSDMAELRQFISTKGAPSDYELPTGIQQLDLTGGGLLRWRNHPVAMVCFNRGDNQMLFLFVVNSSDLADPPPGAPQVTNQTDVTTVSWSKQGKTYVLAGPSEPAFLEKYF